MSEAVSVLLPRSDMRELLEEAGAGLADELAAEHFAANERAVLYQSARMRVLQSREGSGPDATYTRCAHHIDLHLLFCLCFLARCSKKLGEIWVSNGRGQGLLRVCEHRGCNSAAGLLDHHGCL